MIAVAVAGAGAAAAVIAVVALMVVAALMVAVVAAALPARIAAAPEGAPLRAAVEPAEIIAGNSKTWSAAIEKIDLSAVVRSVSDSAADAMMVIQGQTSQAFASSIVAETKSSASYLADHFETSQTTESSYMPMMTFVTCSDPEFSEVTKVNSVVLIAASTGLD